MKLPAYPEKNSEAYGLIKRMAILVTNNAYSQHISQSIPMLIQWDIVYLTYIWLIAKSRYIISAFNIIMPINSESHPIHEYQGYDTCLIAHNIINQYMLLAINESTRAIL